MLVPITLIQANRRKSNRICFLQIFFMTYAPKCAGQFRFAISDLLKIYPGYIITYKLFAKEQILQG